jgi:hypothetical protein
MVRAINLVLSGKVNSTGTVTLAVSPATTTVITNAFLSPDSLVLFDPMTATAAGLDGAGLFVLEANRGTGSWTITHEASAAADRKFRYVVLG